MIPGKIYNVCLERVDFQITNAIKRLNGNSSSTDRIILESYNTGDIEEIVDILEIYDLKARTREGLAEQLEDLAYTVSMLVRNKVAFDYDTNGNLGLYLVLTEGTEDTNAEKREHVVNA